MEPVTFTTEDGIRLEGELRLPDEPPRGTAVLCHPHPKHGGSKDHPLLWAVRNTLASEHELAVLGFNFRGVMGSAGTYAGGHGELRDARSAVTWIRERVGADVPTILVGWSFGASVALREALDDPRVGALVLIGLPLVPADLSLPDLPEPVDLRRFDRPALLLAGEHDEYCPADALRAYAEPILRVTVEVIEGTDHYFWRQERRAAAIVGDFAERALFG